MRKTFIRLLALMLVGSLLLGLVACAPVNTPDGNDPAQDGVQNGGGNENAGNENTGNENTGNENTGNENTGNENTGNENTGNENTGNENTGNENTGNENTGNENSGNNTNRPQQDNTSAAVGTLTGVDSLDRDLKKIIDSVTDGKDTKLKQLQSVYKWVADNFRYRAVAVDLSQGYTEALKIELTQYFLKYRRASCEHYATTVALLFQRLDPAYKPIMVTGERWDTVNKVWGEHAWVIMEYEGRYYHFDGLYGKNHQGDTFRSFMKTDAEMQAHHKWDASQYPACP